MNKNKSLYIAEYKINGYKNNRNAALDDEENASSYIHARCKPTDKAKWVKAAQKEGLKLTEWIIKACNTSSLNHQIKF